MTKRFIETASCADILAEISGYFGSPLGQDEIHIMRNEKCDTLLPQLHGTPQFSDEVSQLRSILMDAEDDEQAVSLLNRSFCHLFLGIGGATGTSPIESAHVGTGRLFQEPEMEMTRLLAERGLKMDETFMEPTDHLSIELSYLEQLIRLETTISDFDEEKAIEDMLVRLNSWVPTFAQNCALHDPSKFYATLAKILVRLLADIKPEELRNAS
ncbi:molecular chaperone TorD family protein [uncultured Cohaesibacter sp.]|uniref:molecular chaperone TorD family protein n=1 Tax=uncultured Cohaesibacter sp. TaxID=1002546 RepID=UPI0029C6D6C0|nr:molecular chaperone TorD family protein [uncultured Cohaesibacter sp.]